MIKYLVVFFKKMRDTSSVNVTICDVIGFESFTRWVKNNRKLSGQHMVGPFHPEDHMKIVAKIFFCF